MELKELQELMLNFISTGNVKELKELLEANYAIDIANALTDFEDDSLLLLFELLDANEIALIMEEAEDDFQRRIVEFIDLKKMVQVFTHMSSDDITDILGIIKVNQRKELLKLMKERDSKDIQMLLGFQQDTAGGIMTTQYIALRRNLCIKDALIKIKNIGPKTEVIESIFVIGINNELVGIADLRDVLISSDDCLLQDIMNENILYVYPDTDQEEVSLIVSKYDLKVLPVVNRKHAILGIITVDDVIDVIVEEHTEDLLMLSGVSKDEKIGSKLSVSIQRRLPWLFINLVTAFLASFTVGLFEDVIVQVVALAAAMPIVAGMGGNAGTQTLSIMIRSIALGEVDIKNDWKYIINEIFLGLINGFATGIITGFIIYLKYDNLFLGIIILVAMIGNLVIASFFGFLIPLLLKRFHLDPAVSSSIFLTTATDVGGFFIFLGMAKMFLPYLV